MIDIRHGDSRVELRAIPDCSVDSGVTDPPYALVSIGKRFGAEKAAPAKAGKTGAYARASAGFMGQKWDTGDTAFDPEFWREVYRVLKPGAFLIAFGGTRTYHRLACAIEDAGFEIRDMVQWLYGSGFPKSHNLPPLSIVATRQTYEGHGSALKPACEPCVLARKPLDGTVLENVLKWGTGTLYVDGCRVHCDDAQGFEYTVERWKPGATLDREGGRWKQEGGELLVAKTPVGRWPANVIHDGSPEVLAAFPEAMRQQGIVTGNEPSTSGGTIYGKRKRSASGPPRDGEASALRRYGQDGVGFMALPGERRDDDGSAARFFYTAKADATDRLGTPHPTVKPTDLMSYLMRLVTPPGGKVLDPFAGSGSTGVAAVFEGFDCILIEREEKYVADIRRRVAWAQGDGKLTQLEKKQPRAKGGGIDRDLV